MEGTGVSVQMASDLVAQYEHFLVTLKERAALFSGQAATVGRRVEKDFEILQVALEQRKNVLLAKIQKEIDVPRDMDMLELTDRQSKMHSLLQQLQKLAIQGSLSADSQCYRELLAELNVAKQKLKETSEKYQLKFESSLASLVTMIASYGEIVSGLGVSSNGTQHAVEAFTNLAQQFEVQCQLACGRSPDGVPDFNAIFKKIKADFIHNSTSNTKAYNMWLVPRTNKPVTEAAITEPFNLIAGSDTSSWLQSTAVPQTMDTSTNLSLWLHSSSTIRSEAVRPAEVFNTIAGTNVSSWLSPSSKQSQQQEDWVTPNVSGLHSCSTRRSEGVNTANLRSEGVNTANLLNTVAATSVSSWLSPSADDKLQSSALTDTADWLHSSNTFGAIANSDAVVWLQQAKDHDYTDWLLCNRSSQDGRCHSPVCSETSTLLLPPGGDNEGDMLSDIFGSTHTPTSFGSSDFEVVDDTDL